MKEKTICVTGGSGFLGYYVVKELEDRGYENIFVPRSKNYDLRKTEAVKRMYKDSGANVVIHLAATVGGIGANRKYPGDLFYDNAKMGIELIEYGKRYGVDKFVTIGTVCAYPKHTSIPFKEENLWSGYPEETNAPYGLAKKMLLVQTQAYHDQYGFNGICLFPVNLYGPRDDFDPEKSHVIPAIIKKCVEAKEENKNKIVAWGTGNPTREFLYVEDTAEGIVDAMENYNSPDPINLGSGMEISIRELVNKIRNLVSFQGKIEWDTSKPDGQPRRRVDSSKAKKRFGWEAKTDFETGLKKTINWYLENKKS